MKKLLMVVAVLAVTGLPGTALAEKPVPERVEVSIDSVGSFKHRTGRFTITGTVTCLRPAKIHLVGFPYQKVGRLMVQDFFFTSVKCGKRGTAAWSADFGGRRTLGGVGQFVGGRALIVKFSWSGCARKAKWSCDHGKGEQVVRLRGKEVTSEAWQRDSEARARNP